MPDPELVGIFIILSFFGLGWHLDGGRFRLPSLRRRRELIEERNEEKWRNWLVKEIPPLEPPLDWDEIERAMGAMVNSGIEPTVERAQTWLRHEREKLEREERERQIESCDHERTYIVDQHNEERCAGCNLVIGVRHNPFKRSRALPFG